MAKKEEREQEMQAELSPPIIPGEVSVGALSLEAYVATLRRPGGKKGGKPAHSSIVQAALLRNLVRSGEAPTHQTPSAWAETLRAALARPSR